jgi:pimeloyl-ACP methyl ester carboxylesterase
MGKSLAMYMSLLRVLLRLVGVRSQVVEIEPGTLVHFWAPAENPNKTKIHNQAKRKPAVVFLHGFGFNGISTWQFQMLALAKDYAIYVPDFLFFGGSFTDKTERSPAFQAECMAKGLKKLGVEKCTLVGLSYGGMVGFKMAEMYPDLVDSMVVTCSVMALTESITRAALERIGFSSWAEVLIPETFEGVKKIAELCTYKSLAMPDFFYRDIFQVISSVVLLLIPTTSFSLDKISELEDNLSIIAQSIAFNFPRVFVFPLNYVKHFCSQSLGSLAMQCYPRFN